MVFYLTHADGRFVRRGKKELARAMPGILLAVKYILFLGKGMQT